MVKFMSLYNHFDDSLSFFVQNRKFLNYEFGKLRRLFIKDFPEFQGKEYYSKIYTAIQALSVNGLITIDKSNGLFKYSSINHSKLKENEFLLKQLEDEMTEISLTVHSMSLELYWYENYLKKFPKLAELINLHIEDYKKKVYSLKAQEKILKNLIEHLKV